MSVKLPSSTEKGRFDEALHTVSAINSAEASSPVNVSAKVNVAGGMQVYHMAEKQINEARAIVQENLEASRVNSTENQVLGIVYLFLILMAFF